MNYRSAMIPAVLLSVAACSAADVNKVGPDVTDLTASEYKSVPPATVQVTPAAVTIAVGASTRLAPVLRDSHGSRIAFAMGVRTVWASSDTTVATVSPVFGTVKGLKDGVVTITLTAGNASGSATLTVGKGAPVVVTEPPTPTQSPMSTTPPSPTIPPRASIPPGASTPPAATTPAATTPAATTPAATTPAATTPATMPPATTPVPPQPTKTPLGTQPAATTTTNATGAGLSGKALVSDDFTRYSSTADLKANISANIGGTGDWHTAMYSDGYHADLAELDRGTLYNGHPTLKYNQLGGQDNGPALWPGFPNGKTLSTMWLRAKIRFSPGYTTTGTLTNSSNAYKLLGWGFAGTDGSGRVEITNTVEYEIYFGGSKPGSTIQVQTTQYGFGGDVDREWSDGGWYDYIVEYHITSPTTAKARVWIAKDGQTPVLRATALGSAAPGNTVPRVYTAELGLNFNQVRAAGQTQAVWYGQWEVVDGDQYADPFHVSGGSN